MANSLQQIEAEIKRDVTRLHKTVIGKGPGHTSIHISDNVLTVIFQNSLSSVEISMLQVPEGYKKINEIRNDLLNANSHNLVAILKRWINTDVQKITSVVIPETAEVYLFIIFKDKVDANIDNRY
ncbi:MAG: hypothetical protein APF76_03010 [Desulfitibacter sp. BRH_c19]|nr:MAG: hypothetical protein APF76_03010 [Desulfitibacter sp. BRH_c19]